MLYTRHACASAGTWLPGRTVVISPQSVGSVSWQDRKLNVKKDKKTIEQSPELRDIKSIETS